MSNTNTGGTAFPSIKIVAGDNYNPPKQYHMPGMTLRDYFAAKAMGALIIDPDRADQSREECARLSYAMADAMLSARAKPQASDPVRDAAPDLLEALQGALKALAVIGEEMTVGERYTNAGQHLIDALMPARAAIAKATGQEGAL